MLLMLPVYIFKLIKHVTQMGLLHHANSAASPAEKSDLLPGQGYHTEKKMLASFRDACLQKLECKAAGECSSIFSDLLY